LTLGSPKEEGIQVTDKKRARSASRRLAIIRIADSTKALSVFDADQLDLIIDFLRRERALLAKHTARVHKMLADRGAGARR